MNISNYDLSPIVLVNHLEHSSWKFKLLPKDPIVIAIHLEIWGPAPNRLIWCVSDDDLEVYEMYSSKEELQKNVIISLLWMWDEYVKQADSFGENFTPQARDIGKYLKTKFIEVSL